MTLTKKLSGMALSSLGLLGVALLTTSAVATTVVPIPQCPTFSITHNATPPVGLLPFKAQDLTIARNDPMDWNQDLKVYVGLVVRQFMNKNGGRTPTNDLQIATAVVDWVSLRMRHPYFWPEDPAKPRMYSMTSNPKYDTIYGEPVRLLNFTLQHDPNDTVNWPSPQCTQQNQAAAGLMNYFGLHARLCDIEGHTGLEYYSFQYHKWIWCDATFNEHYNLVLPDGTRIPLGAKDLNRLTLYGGIESVEVVKHGFPSAKYSEYVYLEAHPHGFRQYAPTHYMRNFDGQGANLMRFDTTVFSPDPPASYVPLPGEVIHFDRPPSYLGWYFWPKTSAAETIDYPLDGLAVSGIIQPNNSGITFSVTSYLPYTTSFQVRYQNDTSWRVLETILTPATTPASSRPFTLNWAVGQVRIRAVDNLGNVTRDLSVNLPQ